MKPLHLILLALSIALSTLAFAKEKQHLPLPSQIKSAKTIYIDNQSRYAELGDRAYEQLKKWGRWEVVADRQNADLILLLSAQEHDDGSVGTTTSWTDKKGIVHTTSNATGTTVGYTFITVIDAKTRRPLTSCGATRRSGEGSTVQQRD